MVLLSEYQRLMPSVLELQELYSMILSPEFSRWMPNLPSEQELFRIGLEYDLTSDIPFSLFLQLFWIILLNFERNR